MELQWNKDTQRWAIGAAIVVVLAFASWWFFTGAPVEEATTNRNTNTTQSTGTAGTTSGTANERPTVGVNVGEEVSADDQPAGDTVRVVEARLSRVSWVAVRDDVRIYGARRLDPVGNGQTFNDVEVPLLRNTEAGRTYSVVVYADDGDGVFDFKKDSLIDGLDDTFTALHGD
jgi:hypothetical protein